MPLDNKFMHIIFMKMFAVEFKFKKFESSNILWKDLILDKLKYSLSVSKKEVVNIIVGAIANTAK